MLNVATQGVFGDGSGDPGKSSLFFLTLSLFCPGIDLVSDRENMQARAAPLWCPSGASSTSLENLNTHNCINTLRRTHNRNRSPR